MASLATLRNPIAGLERFAFQGNVVRVHTVEREANPAFWKLLHKCGESAAAPILVNTSFNLFGEPLVTDPRGAVRAAYCNSRADARRRSHPVGRHRLILRAVGGARTSRQRAVTYGLNEDLLSPLRVAIRYAREQDLIRSDVTVEEIFADFTRHVGE